MKTLFTLTIAVLAATMSLVQAAPLNKANVVALRSDNSAYADAQAYDQELAAELASEQSEVSHSNRREADNSAYADAQAYDQELAAELASEQPEVKHNDKRKADNSAYADAQEYDQELSAEMASEYTEVN